MKYAIPLLVILAIGVGVYTYMNSKTGPYATPPVDALKGTSWTMASIGKEGIEIEESVLEFGFALAFAEGDRLSGRICNTFSGSYDENGPSFRSDEIVSTKIACSGVAGEVEADFLDALRSGVVYETRDGGLLVLTDHEGGRRFFFTLDRSAAD